MVSQVTTLIWMRCSNMLFKMAYSDIHALQNGSLTHHSGAHLEQHLRSSSQQQLGQSATATIYRSSLQPTTTTSSTTVSPEMAFLTL